MKKWLVFDVAIVLFLVFSLCSPSPATAAPASTKATPAAVTLKAMVPWPKDTPSNAGFRLFVNKVNEKAKGALTINIVGGPESIPAANQFDALKTGVVQVLNYVTDYYQAQLQEASAITFATASSKEIRARGYWDFMAELHKHLNVIPIGRTGDGIRFSLFSNKRIDSPAGFKGLRFRTVPVFQPFVQALGAVPVTLSGPEIYGALERGVVDGTGSVMINLTAQGYYEVIKYAIDHEFYNGNHFAIFNLDSWNKLPKNLQDICIQSVIEVENESPAIFAKVVRDDVRKACIAKGMTFIKFSKQDAETYLNLAYSSGWADFLTRCRPEYKTKLQQMLFK